jgi:hypothetical protein
MQSDWIFCTLPVFFEHQPYIQPSISWRRNGITMILLSCTMTNKIGINASLMRRYKTGMKKASHTQKAKIYDGIYAIAQQLSAVRF